MTLTLTDPDPDPNPSPNPITRRDTLPLYGTLHYTIRFVAPFLGRMMVHCHIQKHSEGGMMALARIVE